MNEVPLLYEAGAEGRFDAVVVITAPRELRAERGRRPARRTRAAPDPGRAEDRAGRFLVRQRRLTRGSRRVRGRRRSYPERSVSIRSLLALVILLAAVAFGFVYLRDGEPTWVDRVRYPLHYEQIVRGHARNYHLDPALVAAVIYQESKFRADAKSSSGAIGLMQLKPETGEGIADPHGRQPLPRRQTSTTPRSTSATARGTYGICSTSTATRRPRSPPTTRASRTSTAGVTRGGDPVLRDARLRRPRRAPEARVRPRVRPLGELGEHHAPVGRRRWRNPSGVS